MIRLGKVPSYYSGTLRGAVQDGLNPVRSLGNRLVFPHADDDPPGVTEAAVGISVAGSVSSDLGSPECGVCLGRSAVPRASMPVAAIDEDCDAGPGE